ncbi:PEP-CTERM sorting domain-containing protein [Luteolibacter sp. SL250]|uniref:PEP-CTERM sorting domain-containing protein n=1 Tax=Luteolibacter sp. SL250 TaxID=2995170 RepID=UPI0022707C4E|nr:PEP-CTERM sorting domain-containing protein [Luteolibacter sp. SL250]WAC20691.1 PEP-CTERM sorting domain-containing protein [Luteolibacter sp. SL250]
MKPPSVFLVCLLLLNQASAAVYFLNFGNGGDPLNVPTTVQDQTNSPYHTENPSFAGTVWNNLTTADVGSGIVDAAGASSSLGINLGVAPSTGSTSINLAAQPGGHSAVTGTAFSSNIYANNSVGRYAIFSNSTANNATTNRIALGLQISGLAAGTYDIYTLTRNTNTSSAQTFQVHLGTSASAGNFDFSGYSSESISMSTGANTAWVDNTNYLKQTITIADGEFLNIAVDGTSGQTRGFLNAIQIVQVPEPSSLLTAGMAGSFAFRRRRR